jgi:hypothetical protein
MNNRSLKLEEQLLALFNADHHEPAILFLRHRRQFNGLIGYG